MDNGLLGIPIAVKWHYQFTPIQLHTKNKCRLAPGPSKKNVISCTLSGGYCRARS